MQDGNPKVTFIIECTKKEETPDGFCITMGEKGELPRFKIGVLDKKAADVFIVGREYRCSFKLNNEQRLTASVLQTVHPGLSYLNAKSLLEFCEENKIDTIGSYGDGSIMYPKWDDQFKTSTGEPVKPLTIAKPPNTNIEISTQSKQ